MTTISQKPSLIIARQFCKTVNGTAYVIRIRPVGPTLPRDGWRLVDEPRLGFATLTR